MQNDPRFFWLPEQPIVELKPAVWQNFVDGIRFAVREIDGDLLLLKQLRSLEDDPTLRQAISSQILTLSKYESYLKDMLARADRDMELY